MGKLTRRAYVAQQYANGQNLDARIRLHTDYSVNQYGWFKWVCDRLESSWPDKVLELGCGTGKLWLECSSRIPDDTRVILSDLSYGMVDQAAADLDDLGGIQGAIVADAQHVPFQDHCIGAVLALFMLYHVPDRALALSEVCRILRPGGRLYAATVGEDHMRELRDLVRVFDPSADVWTGSLEESFSLQTGAAELERWFPKVVCHWYDDALEVTDSQPLIDYVLSTDAGVVLTGEKRLAFCEYVQRELDQRRSIHITKQSGLFEALV